MTEAQFVGVYLLALVTAHISTPLVRRGLSHVRARGPEPVLGRYDAAYLVGGPGRVVDTAIGSPWVKGRVTARGYELIPIPGRTGGVLETVVLQQLQQMHGARRNRIARTLRCHRAVIVVRFDGDSGRGHFGFPDG